MKSMVLLVLAAIAIGACSPPARASTLDSGIVGHATIGPTCPVVRVGDPCPDKPYAALLIVLSADGKTEIARVQADADGYFKLALAPGTYVIRPASPMPMPRAADTLVDVPAHEFKQVDISYDSGIR